MPSIGISSGLGSVRVFPSWFMRTCYATVAATRWRTRATIPVPFKTGLGTGLSNIQFDIPSCRRPDSRTSGAKGSGGTAIDLKTISRTST
jgi:hypothetical protein